MSKTLQAKNKTLLGEVTTKTDLLTACQEDLTKTQTDLTKTQEELVASKLVSADLVAKNDAIQAELDLAQSATINDELAILVGTLTAQVELMKKQVAHSSNRKNPHSSRRANVDDLECGVCAPFREERCCAGVWDKKSLTWTQCQKKHKEGLFCGTHAKKVSADGKSINSSGLYTELRPTEWGEGQWECPKDFLTKKNKTIRYSMDQAVYEENYKNTILPSLPTDWVFQSGLVADNDDVISDDEDCEDEDCPQTDEESSEEEVEVVSTDDSESEKEDEEEEVESEVEVEVSEGEVSGEEQ